MPKQKAKTESQRYEQLGRMLATIYESGYVDHVKTYKMSFLKGLASGFGGVIGATIVVAILLWILTLLSEIPFAEPIIRTVQDTIQKTN